MLKNYLRPLCSGQMPSAGGNRSQAGTWSFQFSGDVLKREKARYGCKSIRSSSDGWGPTKLGNTGTEQRGYSKPPNAQSCWTLKDAVIITGRANEFEFLWKCSSSLGSQEGSWVSWKAEEPNVSYPDLWSHKVLLQFCVGAFSPLNCQNR